MPADPSLDGMATRGDELLNPPGRLHLLEAKLGVCVNAPGEAEQVRTVVVDGVVYGVGDVLLKHGIATFEQSAVCVKPSREAPRSGWTRKVRCAPHDSDSPKCASHAPGAPGARGRMR